MKKPSRTLTLSRGTPWGPTIWCGLCVDGRIIKDIAFKSEAEAHAFEQTFRKLRYLKQQRQFVDDYRNPLLPGV